MHYAQAFLGSQGGCFGWSQGNRHAPTTDTKRTVHLPAITEQGMRQEGVHASICLIALETCTKTSHAVKPINSIARQDAYLPGIEDQGCAPLCKVPTNDSTHQLERCRHKGCIMPCIEAQTQPTLHSPCQVRLYQGPAQKATNNAFLRMTVADILHHHQKTSLLAASG